MVSSKSIFALSVALINNVIAASVGSISDCPALAPRASPAKDITDLRIDDINIVAGLGDR